MDENSALARDYLLTIESMQNEVEVLREKLALTEDAEDSVSDEANYEDLQGELENNYQEIEKLSNEINENISDLLGLKAEKDWLISKFPE